MRHICKWVKKSEWAKWVAAYVLHFTGRWPWARAWGRAGAWRWTWRCACCEGTCARARALMAPSADCRPCPAVEAPGDSRTGSPGLLLSCWWRGSGRARASDCRLKTDNADYKHLEAYLLRNIGTANITFFHSEDESSWTDTEIWTERNRKKI